MKKISFVLIALLALVAFTGCPTAHDDYDYATVPDIYIIGGFSADFTKMTPVAGTTTQTFEFTFVEATMGKTQWGSDQVGRACFKCTDAPAWGGAEPVKAVDITVGNGYSTVGTGSHSSGNAAISGLVDGNSYVITVDYGTTPYKVKCDAK